MPLEVMNPFEVILTNIIEPDDHFMRFKEVHHGCPTSNHCIVAPVRNRAGFKMPDRPNSLSTIKQIKFSKLLAPELIYLWTSLFNWHFTCVYFSVETGIKKPKVSNEIDCVTCDVSKDCQWVDAKFSASGKYYILECLGPGVPNYTLRATDPANSHLSTYATIIL